MQEQAAALLNQLHQQDPSRVTPQPPPHPRGSFAQGVHHQTRQPLLLTPGMGSVGSVSPTGGARTDRHHAADHEASNTGAKEQYW